MMDLLTIGIGGFLGAIGRYLIFMADRSLYQHYHFPLGTLFVNLAGSLLIGIALGLSVKYDILVRSSTGHYLFVTGFLGAFTTFSTFSQDNLILLMDRQYGSFTANILLNVVFGLALAGLGYFMVRGRVLLG